jgi:hypothetical protein
MAGVVVSAGAGFHWISLETQRGSSEIKKRSRKSCKETDEISGERQCGSLGPRRWPGACCCCLPWSLFEY